MKKNRLANKIPVATWFQSLAVNSFVKREAKQLSRALRLARGPNVLIVGEPEYSPKLLKLDFPLTVRVLSSAETNESSDNSKLDIDPHGPQIVYADASFLPFYEDTFQTVILAHAIENNELPHQLLREADRVLTNDGHIIVAGFNPMSLFSLQYKLRFTKRYAGKLYSLYRTKDWLKLLGFETVGSAMYQYAPISSRKKASGEKKRVAKPRRISGFIEAVGDRWFPMFGGAYVLVAKKRTLGIRMKPKSVRLSARKRLVGATANKVIPLNSRKEAE